MAPIIAIGASLGGVGALRTLVAGLPASFEAPILVVLHTGAASSLLPSLLTGLGPIEASHAVDGEPIRPGHIHIAPPDRHLLVADGHLRLSRGPRENWARPAIDPLFRSTADAFGSQAIGVVLTGNLNDGTAGLYEIKRRGGIAVIQNPAEAEAPSMPRSALENVAVDYCVALKEIPPLLARLTRATGKSQRRSSGVPAMSNLHHSFAVPTAQTCPECGGAMREEKLGNFMQFRCHIGHVMSAEVLASANLERLRDDIATCVRAANERSELCREIARKHDAHGASAPAESWRRAAEEADARARFLAEFAEQSWVDPETAPEPVE